MVGALAEKQGTRTKVSDADVTTKAAAKATETMLRTAAADNVLKASKKVDKECTL